MSVPCYRQPKAEEMTLRDDVEKALREVIPKFLNDPRTITFTVHRNIEDASKFFAYEKYESR